MRAVLRKLGNSSGVIIPKSLLRDLGIAEGDPVEMTLEAGRIVLVPIKRRARAGWAEASQRSLKRATTRSCGPSSVTPKTKP